MNIEQMRNSHDKLTKRSFSTTVLLYNSSIQLQSKPQRVLVNVCPDLSMVNTLYSGKWIRFCENRSVVKCTGKDNQTVAAYREGRALWTQAKILIEHCMICWHPEREVSPPYELQSDVTGETVVRSLRNEVITADVS